jgi:hypothetical protein
MIGRMRSIAALLFFLSACTLRVDKVDVPQPKITIDCVIVELPGGSTVRSCDAGSDSSE